MKRINWRQLIAASAVYVITLFIQPFVIFNTMSKFDALQINIGKETIKIKGYLKEVFDFEKGTTYIKDDPLRYFPLIEGNLVSIKISRLWLNEIGEKGKYALTESFSGIENGKQTFEFILQDPSGELINIIFYGEVKKVADERLQFLRQINKKKFLPSAYCDMAKPFIRDRNNRVIQRIKSGLLKDQLLSQFIWAIDNGNKNLVMKILSNKSLMDFRDENGYNVLHLSCLYSNDVEILSELLRKGIKINSKGDTGFTPLMLAVKSGRPIRMIEFLLSNGADVNLTNKVGETALHIASYEGDKEIVALLIKHGAMLEKKDENGLAALHWASFWGHTDIVDMLIEAGADINSKTNAGFTPLHLAAISGAINSVRRLLLAGADPNLKDNSGMTAFDKALFNENKQVIDELNNLKSGKRN